MAQRSGIRDFVVLRLSVKRLLGLQPIGSFAILRIVPGNYDRDREAIMSAPDVRRTRIAWTVGIIWMLLGGIISLSVAAACAFTLLAGHLTYPMLHGLGLICGFLLTPAVLMGSAVFVGVALKEGRNATTVVLSLLVANIVVAVGSVAITYIGTSGL